MVARLPRTAFIAGAAAVTTFSLTRAAEFEYKLGSALPAEHPTQARLVQMFKDVENETHGRLVTKVYPNSQLGTEASLTNQLRIGAIEFYMIGSSVSGVVPEVNLVGIPFAFDSDAPALAAYDGELGQYVTKAFTAKGLYCFPTVWNFGMRHLTTSNRPVRVPEDMAGLKIRTSAAKINEDFFKAFGASPVSIATAESYTALQTHVCDGVETTLALIEGNRWQEVQRYLSLTNHIWSNLYLLANPQKLNALPPDVRASLERNARKYALLERKDSFTLNGALTDKLHREGLTVNRVDIAPFRRRLDAQYRSWKNEFGPVAWGLLEKYSGKLA